MKIIEVEKKPESIVNAIRYAEVELQDNFLEYRDIFPDSSFLMSFAYKNGYISEQRFLKWKEGFEDNDCDAMETFQVLLGDDEEFSPYAMYHEENMKKEDPDNIDECYEKALLVYGKLICSKDEYYNEFLEELKIGEGNLQDLIVNEL